MPKVKFSINLFMHREAEFSECRQYRYSLLIVWNPDFPVCAFIGLNPSTADEICDDNTVRRCRGYAESWGCGGLLMLNIFAFRATEPRVMKAQASPIGGGNTLSHIKKRLAACTGPHVAAWGTHGSFMGRGEAVAAAIPSLMCLAHNADGSPMHPLYQSKDLVPIPFIQKKVDAESPSVA